MSDYQVVVYNVFIERGNVGVLTCSIPAPVRDWVEVLGWWRVPDKKAAREEIHSGGRYLVTSAGQYYRVYCLQMVRTVNAKNLLRQKLNDVLPASSVLNTFRVL